MVAFKFYQIAKSIRTVCNYLMETLHKIPKPNVHRLPACLPASPGPLSGISETKVCHAQKKLNN